MAIQISSAIFLHIPKTGGTWVTQYFRETGMDHGDEVLGLRAHINGDRLNELIDHTEDLVFCFVRHPLTWYRSFWQHRRFVPDRTAVLDDIVDLPFHEYIESILKHHLGYLTEFFLGYTKRCRFTGKQENLREDLDNVLKYLRFPYNREHLFKKKPENVVPSDQKYTSELAYAVMEAEKEVVERYNYNYLPLEVMDV